MKHNYIYISLFAYSINFFRLFISKRYLVLMLTTFFICGCENDLDDLSENDFMTEKSMYNTPRVLVNGVPLSFRNIPAEQTIYGIAVPAAELAERLGYTVKYDFWKRLLLCTKGTDRIEIYVGKLEAKVNGKKVDLKMKPFFRLTTLMVSYELFMSLEGMDSEYDDDTNSLQLYDYNELDYGLYFFGKQEQTTIDVEDAIGSQKFIAGQYNKFYDPNKPTVIWIHGWQNGGIKEMHRNNFHLKTDDIDKYVHNAWIDRGWNVAIFNWVALADEILPHNAESKINTTRSARVGMRWKKADGSYETNDVPKKSIAELFAEAYEKLAEVQVNPQIRLVGSSFGGQVVLHGTKLIKDHTIAPLPTRIALLDMAWTQNYIHSQQMLTKVISERAASAISSDVLIECYRSSLIPTPFTPRKLVEESAFQEMVFSYAGALGIELKHTVITEHYFWSIEYESPTAFSENDIQVGVGLSASTTNEELREMMGDQYHWQHIKGRDSFDPGDDIFERQNGVW